MVYLEKIVEISSSSENLREERRRTGKFMAAGTAIFLSILGLYEALIRGTPEYAALFAPALIMFVYITWVLYVSTRRRRIIKEENAVLTEISPRNSIEPITEPEVEESTRIEIKNDTKPTILPHYYRSYSIG